MNEQTLQLDDIDIQISDEIIYAGILEAEKNLKSGEYYSIDEAREYLRKKELNIIFSKFFLNSSL